MEISASGFLKSIFSHARGQWFFFKNVSGMATALSFGFFAVAYVETIASILMFTKQSSTPALAYRRFRANGQHLLIWYQNSLQPGSKLVKWNFQQNLIACQGLCSQGLEISRNCAEDARSCK